MDPVYPIDDYECRQVNVCLVKPFMRIVYDNDEKADLYIGGGVNVDTGEAGDIYLLATADDLWNNGEPDKFFGEKSWKTLYFDAGEY